LTIDHSEDSARLRRVYQRASKANNPSLDYAPTLAQKKEQLKQLKLNVSDITSKMKYGNERKKTYALSPSPEPS